MSIKVGIVGVGNCASALVQGVHFYRVNPDAPGQMTKDIGGYEIGDIEFVVAFDVDSRKIGQDLGCAIFEEPNNAQKFWPQQSTGAKVCPGPLLDGVGETASKRVDVAVHNIYHQLVPVKQILAETGCEVLVNFLPVGSSKASVYYAMQAACAGVAFVNAIPTRIARDGTIAYQFAQRGVPLIGDDIKSQFGATILHRMLAELMSSRGVEMSRTYQLNFGGNMDFYNMLTKSRLADKRESKQGAVTSVANRGEGLDKENVHIGPSDYVEWLGDRKVAQIRCEGEQFAGLPFNVEIRLDVADSPNSAGVVVDAIRYAKVAAESGHGGTMPSVSAWLMKAPPVEMDEDEALAGIHNWRDATEYMKGDGPLVR